MLPAAGVWPRLAKTLAAWRVVLLQAASFRLSHEKVFTPLVTLAILIQNNPQLASVRKSFPKVAARLMESVSLRASLVRLSRASLSNGVRVVTCRWQHMRTGLDMVVMPQQGQVLVMMYCIGCTLPVHFLSMGKEQPAWEQERVE